MMAGGVETRSSATALRNPRSDLSLRPGMEIKGDNEISRYIEGLRIITNKHHVNDDIFRQKSQFQVERLCFY